MRIKLSHQPNLTAEKAAEIISKHYGYQVVQFSKEIIAVEKNTFIAATLQVNQKEDYTEIITHANVSSKGLNLLMLFLCLFTGVGLLVSIILFPFQLGFALKVADFIKSSPDFNP